jgi:MinD-like ATPase involved in chromosome partitioning or flagellar assembly
VLVTCWSVKGGSGTSVVAASLAVVAARRQPSLLVDLAGDSAAILGLAEPASGVWAWLGSPSAPAAALTRLETDGAPGLRLLPAGPPSRVDDGERGALLAALLGAETRSVIVDAGRIDGGAGAAEGVRTTLAGAASVSLLVLRPCYLALRRAVAAPVRPSGVVLITEPGRALGRSDVEQVLGVPVRAEIALDPGVARAVDAGLLATRLPRGLERALRDAA